MATPHCSVCVHPQRDAIDGALRAGDSLRQVAERFRLTRSTAARHKTHLAPLAVPAPTAVVPALPTVAQAQAALQALLAELSALPGHLKTLQAQLKEVAFDRNIVRDVQNDKRQLPALEQHVEGLQAQLVTAAARQQALPALVQQAEAAVQAAMTRRATAVQQHWQWVRAQKSPKEWDVWSQGEGELIGFMLALQAFYGGGMGPPGGCAPTPSTGLLLRYGSMAGLDQRRRLMTERLLTVYPFREV